jgi:type VI secretion system protein ImpH
MASESGRDAAPLAELVREEIERFEFVQAVRLLGLLSPERAPVGFDHDPLEEIVRFRSDVSLVFPRSDVQRFEPAEEDAPPRVTVNFMGVATPASFGSLPQRYAETILEVEREHKNGALRDFLDLFNHRLVSLFFRACARGLPVLQIERGEANAFELALSAVLGLATPGLAERLTLPDRALKGHAGLLSRRPISALALESLLRSLFELPVEVHQFQPRRFRMERDDWNGLGVANCTLGEDCYLGSEVTLVDASLRLAVGPVDRARFERLLPIGADYRALVEVTRFALRDGQAFDLELALDAGEVPELRLGGADVAEGRLGWSAWLAGPPRSAPAVDAVLVPVPVHAFPLEVTP